MKKNRLLKTMPGVVLSAVCALSFTACGGGGGSSSGEGSSTAQDGFAPNEPSEDMVLVPTDPNVVGQILLTSTPARVAYFNNKGGTGGAYTGNYTYTKCGPNLAEVKIVNVRYEPIDTANDCHWTIIGHLTFVDERTVVFTGTETLVGTEEAGHNDPMGFGSDQERKDSFVNDHGIIEAPNHFDSVIHKGGGTRNFSLNYVYSSENEADEIRDNLTVKI